MVTIGMYYEVLEGKEQFFEKAFTSVLGAIQTAEEHRSPAFYAIHFPSAAASSCQNGPVTMRSTNLYVRMSLFA